jgi:hypothetical protein
LWLKAANGGQFLLEILDRALKLPCLQADNISDFNVIFRGRIFIDFETPSLDETGNIVLWKRPKN